MAIQQYEIFLHQYAAIDCALMMSEDPYESINCEDGIVRQRWELIAIEMHKLKLMLDCMRRIHE